jgi:ketosteroid isomerase-like protein
LDGFVSFYADDASAFPFNAPIANGKEQIRQLWSQLMSKPGFGLSFKPTKIEVGKSGDLAYETGTFELSERSARQRDEHSRKVRRCVEETTESRVEGGSGHL